MKAVLAGRGSGRRAGAAGILQVIVVTAAARHRGHGRTVPKFRRCASAAAERCSAG